MAKVIALTEGSADHLVSGLETNLHRIDDLAHAAEAIVELELGRQEPAGALTTLLGLLRETAGQLERDWLFALETLRRERAA